MERVTLIARFIDSTPLRNVLPLQASMANIFCYLINSMDDSMACVAQKATLYLGTIHDMAIKVSNNIYLLYMINIKRSLIDSSNMTNVLTL